MICSRQIFGCDVLFNSDEQLYEVRNLLKIIEIQCVLRVASIIPSESSAINDKVYHRTSAKLKFKVISN